MAINKKLLLNWAGTDYEVKITMRVIDDLDEQLNLMTMVKRCSEGDVRFSHAAKLIAILLRHGGAKVEDDDVFEAMFGGDEITLSQVIEMLGEIFNVIFPTPKKSVLIPVKKRKKS